MNLNEAKNYVEALANMIDSKECPTAKNVMPPVAHQGSKVLFIVAVAVVLSLVIFMLVNLDKLL